MYNLPYCRSLGRAIQLTFILKPVWQAFLSKYCGFKSVLLCLRVFLHFIVCLSCTSYAPPSSWSSVWSFWKSHPIFWFPFYLNRLTSTHLPKPDLKAFNLDHPLGSYVYFVWCFSSTLSISKYLGFFQISYWFLTIPWDQPNVVNRYGWGAAADGLHFN